MKFVLYCLLSSDDMLWAQHFETISISSDSFIYAFSPFLLSVTMVIDNRFIIQIISPIFSLGIFFCLPSKPIRPIWLCLLPSNQKVNDSNLNFEQIEVQHSSWD